MIVAVITIVGSVATAVEFGSKFIHQPDSSVEMGNLNVTTNAGLDFDLVNSGDRDAALLDGSEIVFKTSSLTKSWGIELLPPDYMPGFGLPEGRKSFSGFLQSHFIDVRQFVKENKNDLSQCYIEVHINNFRQRKSNPKGYFDCRTFARALETTTPLPGSGK